jgi:hypothetical protein
MTAPGADSAFDAMLAEALAPPKRDRDPGFVAKVDRAVVERERYLRQRSALRRQLGGEMLALAALGGSIALLARIPDVSEALAEAPILAWPALLSLLLFWLVVTRMQRLPA